MTFLKNITCSSLRGTAKPLIIEARMSRSSATPLNLQVSWIRVRKQSFLALRIILRRGTSLAYNRCRMFFRYSLSFGSSLSNNSKNSQMNWWVMNTFRDFTSAASFTINCRKNSYTGCKWGHSGSITISSSSIPFSPVPPYFFSTGKGLKMFFSIISITKSRWGITRFTTVDWS